MCSLTRGIWQPWQWRKATPNQKHTFKTWLREEIYYLKKLWALWWVGWYASESDSPHGIQLSCHVDGQLDKWIRWAWELKWSVICFNAQLSSAQLCCVVPPPSKSKTQNFHIPQLGKDQFEKIWIRVVSYSSLQFFWTHHQQFARPSFVPLKTSSL